MDENLVSKMCTLYMEILDYVKSKDFDQKVFEVKHKNLSSWYRKADYQEQGEFHHRLNLGREGLKK